MSAMFLTVCLTFLVALQLETSSGEPFGSCIETCSLNPEDPNGFGACEEGYVCKSNGCGHTCHLAVPEKIQRGACVIACSPFPDELGLPTCKEGHECRSNGCGQTCQPVIPAKKSQRGACVISCSDVPNEFGLTACKEGYQCKPNGCGRTCQPVVPEKSQRGACVIDCSPVPDELGLPGCSDGYECRFNGCGRTCQREHTTVPAVPKKKAEVGECVEACSPALRSLGFNVCPEGFVCRSNGCGHTCQLDTEVAKPLRCDPVLCEIYCLKGFALDERGCEVCKCQE